MKYVVDTNVILSFLDFKRDFLELVKYEIEDLEGFVVPETVLEEINKKINPQKAKKLLDYFLRKHNIIIEKVEERLKDKDSEILEFCLKKKYGLITFDKKFAERAKRKGIKVITFHKNKVLVY